MSEIQRIYLEFLANFPTSLRPIISIGLAVLLVYSIFKVIKKDFVYIIALVVLLPASKPILQSVWQGVVGFIKFLLNTK
jgi:hypothetical protein